MFRLIKEYLECIFIKLLIIVYLFFMIIYQLNAPTNAFFSDSQIHYGKLSVVDVFQEEGNEDDTKEMETDDDHASDPAREEEKRENYEVQNDEDLKDETDRQNMSGDEKIHQDRESEALSEQLMEENSEKDESTDDMEAE